VGAVSPLAVQVLRRLALLALVAAAALAALPPALRELGMGGGPQGAVDAAARGIDVARSYGARESDPPLAAALAELERARGLLARGQGRPARSAAHAARERAVEAQRAALARREDTRRRAQQVVLGIDKRISALEELYGQVTPGLDRPTVNRLLDVMKEARAAGAALFLAQQQGSHDKVVAEEAATVEVLEAARRQLEAARRPPPAR
jgi:hypothetical protein